MGKSPGRWIKALIFGKKSPRSKNPKPNDEKKDVKEVAVSLDQRTELKTEENLQPGNSKQEVCISAAPPELNSQNDSDRIREQEAVIDLQAAVRGYLARRTFQSLKGIIRLQALIRGHLVRRQVISTLYCMFQIVKFQAIARGRMIRNSNIGVQVQKRCNPLNRLVMGSVEVNRCMQILKLSSNSFARKILASSPTPMPLHFQYDSNESNSVLSWLERWSTSQCWHLLQKPQSCDLPSKPQKPHIRRSSVTNIASEFDKPIWNSRKVSFDKPVNCIEENPELVLERVKRNLRKVNSSVLQKTITEQEELRVIEAETMIIKKNEKEDESVNERKKSRRVVCVQVKHEPTKNDEPLQIKRSVPSYMAATVSAKAKLIRGQHGPENLNPITRRHSLPSLTNANVSVSAMAKTTGKLKNDRSLLLSRDGNVSVRVNQAEWRR